MNLEFTHSGLDTFEAANPEILLQPLRDKCRSVIAELQAKIDPSPLPECVQGSRRAKITTTRNDSPMRFSYEMASDPIFSDVLVDATGLRFGRLLANHGLQAEALLAIKRIVKENFEEQVCVTVIAEVELHAHPSRA
jgi:hypothetical protein